MQNDAVWDNPGMTEEMFDQLLGDVLKYLIDRVYEAGAEYITTVIHMALWDEKQDSRGWASAEFIDAPEDKDDRDAMFAAAGVMVVQSGNVPVAAFLTKSARMEMRQGDTVEKHDGFVVIGMTYDSRLNGCFLALDEDGQPRAAQMFYSRNLDDDNTIDSDALHEFFRAARMEYRVQKGMPVDKYKGRDLERGLFRNVKGFGDKTDD